MELVELHERQKILTSEDSIEFVIGQIKIICHNILFSIYSNAVFVNMIQPPEIKDSISEIVRKVCFTSKSMRIQIFISSLKMAEVLAVNLAESLKTSETINTNLPIEISECGDEAVVDIYLVNSRVKEFFDFEEAGVYSI
jgi:hypothetical protein